MLQTAVSIAREAGDLLRVGFSQHKEITRKSSQVDLVTQYDGQAEKLITDRLRVAFPDHRIIGEEGAASDGDNPYIWYIDPLDGTVNYAHGFPVYSVSLALYRGDEPVLGVVYDPERDECFTAIRGGGGAVTRGQGAPRPLAVSPAVDLGDCLLGTGFPYDRRTSDLDNVAQTRAFLKTAQGVRRTGSAALDLCYVAAGRLDGFWEFKLKIWDVAASALMVMEAGGRVAFIDDGAPYTPRPVLNLFAANPLVHEQMWPVLQSV